MPLDTARNRFGILLGGLPFPTGAVDAPTRIELLHGYPGIAFAEPGEPFSPIVSLEHVIAWEVRPSPNRVEWALRGRFGPVVARWRFERQTLGGQFLQDVTPAFVANEGEITANNDRAIFRQARFTIDLSAADDQGNPISINPLTDYIAVIYRVLVDNEWWEDIPAGLFVLVAPSTIHTPADRRRSFEAFDVGFLLVNNAVDATYTIAASTNYVTAAQAVIAAANASLRVALPPSSAVTPVDMSWVTGTPHMQVLTRDGQGLVDGINRYQVWADRHGVLVTREREDWATRAPDVTYEGSDIEAQPIVVSAANIHYNRIIATVGDPSRDPLYAVAVNNDPTSPISTVSTGRTFTRTVRVDRVVDQQTLDEIAAQYLRDEATEYERATIGTYPDPRRDAHEVYQVAVPGVIEGTYRCQSWRLPLEVGAVMTHELRRTVPVAITVEAQA